jgi:osmotically-inducible protein OsmY
MHALRYLAAPVLVAVAASVAAAPLDSTSRAQRNLMPSNALHAGGVTYEDQQIASDILTALNTDPQLRGATVTVVSHDGHVTLTGTARDAAQVQRVTRVAREASKASSVVATIDVAGG